jgi:hypothetical protein
LPQRFAAPRSDHGVAGHDVQLLEADFGRTKVRKVHLIYKMDPVQGRRDDGRPIDPDFNGRAPNLLRSNASVAHAAHRRDGN